MRRFAPKRLPKPIYPDSAERQYLRFLNRYVGTYVKLMRRGLGELVPELKEEVAESLPHFDGFTNAHSQVNRMDANVAKSVASLFESVNKSLEAIFPDATIRKWALAMVGGVNRNSKKNTERVAEALDADVGPLLRDGELTPYFKNVVDQNVGLIRSLPQGRQSAFKNQLVDLISSDATQETIRESIMKHFDYSKSQASVIARDQVGKLNGKVTQYRQKSIGGQRYTWRCLRDGRERPDHERLDGKVFSWDDPPVVNRSTGARGHPGDDIQCRCFAEMVPDDIVD